MRASEYPLALAVVKWIKLCGLDFKLALCYRKDEVRLRMPWFEHVV